MRDEQAPEGIALSVYCQWQNRNGGQVLASGLNSDTAECYAFALAKLLDEAGSEAVFQRWDTEVPDDVLVELRRRVNATRWPCKETVVDQLQGVPEVRLQELVRNWGTSYDWRKVAGKLNALPKFTTAIDLRCGDFLDARLRVLGAADGHRPARSHGPRLGCADEATGLQAQCRPRRRLGIGGCGRDGAPGPAGLLGIHVNMPTTVAKDLAKALNAGGPAPANLSAKEKAAYDQLNTFFKTNAA
ncbi:epoxide hydrolase N-terminal domain-containing protein [Variovorax sp. GT1P44]|uniref:epoxide hydrolase N-terminal domain-containing protein n=1 Tax=Variovorax sp. GT1P44 TaxID=3443742 RepID=UPI003F44E8C5